MELQMALCALQATPNGDFQVGLAPHRLVDLTRQARSLIVLRVELGGPLEMRSGLLDVLRFQIAMDNPFLVGLRPRRRSGGSPTVEARLLLETRRADVLCQGLTVHQLHGGEVADLAPREELKIPRPAEQEVELVNVGLAFRDAR